MVPKAATAFTSERAPASPASGLRDRTTQPPTARSRLTWFSRNGRQAAPPPEVATLIHDLLDRFDAGDYRGALAASDALLEPGHVVVPVVQVAAVGPVATRPMEARALHVFQLAVGRPTLEELVEASGLPLLDALRAVCELLESGRLGLAAGT